MPNDHSLISTIAVGLGFAFVGGFAANRLRMPPLVGYLLAGIAVGPFTPGFVADVKLAPQLAEIGVILLMFGVGTHFSIRDLWAVRSVAVPGAVGQIVAATALGVGITALWGWPFASGLVFGLRRPSPARLFYSGPWRSAVCCTRTTAASRWAG